MSLLACSQRYHNMAPNACFHSWPIPSCLHRLTFVHTVLQRSLIPRITIAAAAKGVPTRRVSRGNMLGLMVDVKSPGRALVVP